MNHMIIDIYNNNIYAIDFFIFMLISSLSVFLFLTIFLIVILLKKIFITINKRSSVVIGLFKDKQLIFIFLFICIVLLRLTIAYSDDSRTLVAPEKIFSLTPIGVDFYTATFKPALSVIYKQYLYDDIAIYGPSFTLLIAPFALLADAFNMCSLTDNMACSILIYQWMVFLVIIGYFFLILLVSHDWNTRSTLLLFFLSFILGVSGSLGLERGNLDVPLSLLMGFIIFFLYKSKEKKIHKNKSLFFSIIIGFIGAFISSSKIFLILFSLIFLLFSGRRFWAFIAFIVSFLVLMYLPRWLGIPGEIYEFITLALKFDNGNVVTPFLGPGLAYNHSLQAVATIMTDCLVKQFCSVQENHIMMLFSLIMLFVIVILPSGLYILINRKLFLTIKQKVFSLNYMLLGLIFVDALINLLPKMSFDYRLYFSVPITIFLWVYTENKNRARLYCFLSMLCLLIKGFWVSIQLDTSNSSVFDPRVMNIFVILHFFFLILAGLENIAEDIRTSKLMYLKKR